MTKTVLHIFLYQYPHKKQILLKLLKRTLSRNDTSIKRTLYCSPKPVFSIAFDLIQEDTPIKRTLFQLNRCPLKQGFTVIDITCLGINDRSLASTDYYKANALSVQYLSVFIQDKGTFQILIPNVPVVQVDFLVIFLP